MERRRSVAFFIIFLFVLCFPIPSDSHKLSPSISLNDQEQVHEVTIKATKRGEEDRSTDIFRVGTGGSRGVTGGKGGSRKASPKRNAAMNHRPKLFFSTTSVLFTSFIMLSRTKSFPTPRILNTNRLCPSLIVYAPLFIIPFFIKTQTPK
ncbi:Uncharacterized protein HA466_0111670 [Hirschfeldia incana]|nr:Uncharacterized protein HA466_0111670 [Hirschfeldia incana]